MAAGTAFESRYLDALYLLSSRDMRPYRRIQAGRTDGHAHALNEWMRFNLQRAAHMQQSPVLFARGPSPRPGPDSPTTSRFGINKTLMDEDIKLTTSEGPAGNCSLFGSDSRLRLSSHPEQVPSSSVLPASQRLPVSVLHDACRSTCNGADNLLLPFPKTGTWMGVHTTTGPANPFNLQTPALPHADPEPLPRKELHAALSPQSTCVLCVSRAVTHALAQMIRLQPTCQCRCETLLAAAACNRR
ncbi:hypothetical protein B0T10DRAFT_25988 [Thelonectria olida]|uniref:Uncharacterized protein n=1 Tax=Thelonectria olida TaxID=1576542 RepID=A0A9P9AZK3_9HYPO|nr:hypothetical protein B0T10DRAFT_25988 [Thelonectria olida]